MSDSKPKFEWAHRLGAALGMILVLALASILVTALIKLIVWMWGL